MNNMPIKSPGSTLVNQSVVAQPIHKPVAKFVKCRVKSLLTQRRKCQQ